MLPPLLLIGAAAVLLGLLVSEKSEANVNPNVPPSPNPEPEITGGDWTLPASGDQYADAISSSAAAHNVDERLLGRLLYQESHFRDDIVSGRVVSPAGAIGIAQFMPETATDLGVDPLDVTASIDAAAKYLRAQYDRFGNWPAALAAYNWGPGNVSRKGLKNAPAETKAYVAEITTDVFGSNT